MSSRSESALNAEAASSLQVPSIQVTVDEEGVEARSVNGSVSGNESGQTREFARNHSRILPRRHKLSGLMTWRGIVAIIPHFIVGIILIATGCAVQSLREVKPGASHPLSSPQFHKETGNLSNSPLATPGGFQKMDVIESARFQGLLHSVQRHSCEALYCSLHFPLISIAAGCVLILCSFSGALMLAHKMKEYACCHLLWLSVATLFSAVLVAACGLSWNSAHEYTREGILECVSVIIISTSIEILFCILDLYCLSDHFSTLQSRQNMWQRSASSSNRGEETRSSRNRTNAQTRQETRSETRQETAETSAGVDRNGRQRRSPAHAVNVNRRSVAGQGYHGRRRRSGQAVVRDRNFLHPGYHHQAPRNRVRRRPILRAQNHYVTTPAAYSRSRAQSRAARIAAERRNRVDMPMFVIANHDRYLQALNQSMENLERETNRGSVPGDVLPGAIAPTKGNQQDGCSGTGLEKRNVLEKTDSVETTLSSSSMDSSKVIQAFLPHDRQLPTGSKTNRRGFASPEISSFASQESVQLQRTRAGSGYSVILRTKKGMKIQSNQHSESDASCDVATDGVSVLPALLASQQTVLSCKFHRAASAMEDSVFQQPGLEQSSSSTCVTDSEYTPRGHEYPPNQHKTAIASRARFYNTASEGDFSNLGATSSACTAHKRKSHASVSSDSGILDGSSTGGTRVPYGSERKRHYKMPMRGSPKAGLVMRDFTGSNPQFSFSPVSPSTPSYENLHARAGIGSQDNFVFEEQNDGKHERNVK